MKRRNAVMGAIVGVPTLVGFLLLGGPAMAAGGFAPYDDTDPAVTGCSTGATTIASYPIKTPANAVVGTLEVRYSSACDTNWVRVNNTVSGTSATKYIGRYRTYLPAGGTIAFLSTYAIDAGLGWSYGNQVGGASIACIDVLGEIVDSSTLAVIATSGTHTLC